MMEGTSTDERDLLVGIEELTDYICIIYTHAHIVLYIINIMRKYPVIHMLPYINIYTFVYGRRRFY